MAHAKELSDYEKMVAETAAKIYTTELKLQDSQKEINITELISNCLVDAFAIVDAVLEVTRGKY